MVDVVKVHGRFRRRGPKRNYHPLDGKPARAHCSVYTKESPHIFGNEDAQTRHTRIKET